MPVDFVPPELGEPSRVIMLGSATRGWYSATAEIQRERALPRFKAVIEEWLALGARPIGSLDDDLFMVGEPAQGFTWYLLFDIPSLAVVSAMIQRVREPVDGVRLDEYVRFEARAGRRFFLLDR